MNRAVDTAEMEMNQSNRISHVISQRFLLKKEKLNELLILLTLGPVGGSFINFLQNRYALKCSLIGN